MKKLSRFLAEGSLDSNFDIKEFDLFGNVVTDFIKNFKALRISPTAANGKVFAKSDDELMKRVGKLNKAQRSMLPKDESHAAGRCFLNYTKAKNRLQKFTRTIVGLYRFDDNSKDGDYFFFSIIDDSKAPDYIYAVQSTMDRHDGKLDPIYKSGQYQESPEDIFDGKTFTCEITPEMFDEYTKLALA